jgi:hypothetical protein
MKSSRRTDPRLQLLVIVSVSVVSLTGAWLLFQQARDGALWGTTNHGTFVDPPLTVADLGITVDDGRIPFDAANWWIWVVPQGPCEDDCQQALHQLRQLHVLLNRDAARVRRGLLSSDGAASQLAAQYPRLQLLSGNLSELERGIYIVDPLGNLVFHYPMSDAGEPVLNDLKRLLKVSQIG